MSITPGPWTAQHSLSGEVDIDAADDSLICQIPVCEVAAKERMANARAIAALPELLAACDAALHEVPNTELYLRLDSAIRKATGK